MRACGKLAAAAAGVAWFMGLALSSAAYAQAPSRDLFGGYSRQGVDSSGLSGGGLAVSWPLSSRVRIGGEATLQNGLDAGEDVRELALRVGPVLSPRRGHRLSPFIHARAGVVRSRRQIEVFGVAIGPDGVCDGGCAFQFGPVAEAGGGLDLGLTRRVALRLPQLDYQVARVRSEWRGRVRVSAGVVWRFGP